MKMKIKHILLQKSKGLWNLKQKYIKLWSKIILRLILS